MNSEVDWFQSLVVWDVMKVRGVYLLNQLWTCNWNSSISHQLRYVNTVNWIGRNVAVHMRKVDNPECKVIFRPRIKCTTLFLRHALFVRGQSFSVKIFDRLRSGCHLISLGAGDDFRGPSGKALPLPSRFSPLRAGSFLRSLLPGSCYAG